MRLRKFSGRKRNEAKIYGLKLNLAQKAFIVYCHFWLEFNALQTITPANVFSGNVVKQSCAGLW